MTSFGPAETLLTVGVAAIINLPKLVLLRGDVVKVVLFLLVVAFCIGGLMDFQHAIVKPLPKDVLTVAGHVYTFFCSVWGIFRQHLPM